MKKTMVKTFFWVIGTAAIISLAYMFMQHEKLYPSTDDAYISANTIQVAPQVSGRIITVNASNHAFVNESDILIEIDPTPFKIAYQRALANLQSIEENLVAGMSGIEGAKAMVSQAKTNYDLVRKDYDRTLKLAKKKMSSQSQVDKASAALHTAAEKLNQARSQLKEAQQKIGANDSTNAKLRMAKADVAAAKWKLDNTTIRAPASGYLSNYKSSVGDTVAQGMPLFTIVENDEYWVNANYKETSLGYIKPNQEMKIKIDMYPNKTFHGKVVSISPSSGASMALLPPENASGNWVKITQRFPVRIKITDKPDANTPLRIGASAIVSFSNKG